MAETTEHGGYPLFEHLGRIIGGSIVWAPGVEGAVVVGLRGGDFLFESGQDLSIGYGSHDAEVVHLYIEESFSSPRGDARGRDRPHRLARASEAGGRDGGRDVKRPI